MINKRADGVPPTKSQDMGAFCVRSVSVAPLPVATCNHPRSGLISSPGSGPDSVRLSLHANRAQPQQSCQEGPFGQIKGPVLGSMPAYKNRE